MVGDCVPEKTTLDRTNEHRLGKLRGRCRGRCRGRGPRNGDVTFETLKVDGSLQRAVGFRWDGCVPSTLSVS